MSWGGLGTDWEESYEKLRAAALAGETPWDTEAALRMAQLGVVGLGCHRAPWQVVVSQAPEPRWTGSDPRRAALQLAYRMTLGGQ